MDPQAAIALLVVTTGALLMPAVGRRLAIPVAVAEIAYGALVGRSGLGLIGRSEHDAVSLVAGLGFALFLFVAALEIDVAGILRSGARAAAVPFVLAACAPATALGIAALLDVPGWLGLAVGVTSVPLVMAVLREQNLLLGPLGRRVILLAGAGELASIGLLAVFDIVAGARESGVLGVAIGLLWALVALGATLAAAIGLRTLMWWYPDRFVRLIEDEDPRELGVRAGFLLMFAGIALATLGGLEPLLGAFFGGLVVAYVVRSRDVLERKLSGVAYGFFVPAFFVHVGAGLVVEPSVVASNSPLLAFILLAMVASRLPIFVSLAASGLTTPRAGAAALLLAAPLTLQIAVAELGAKNGIFDADVEAAVVLAAVVSGVVFPALARRLLGSDAAPGTAAAQAPRHA